ncbi:MAG TPA: RidA family protein [bacterium]|nr:RidA family protein [bacterium]
MQRHTVSTDEAPQAVGPYSQAVVSGGFVFTAGQIPLNLSTGELEQNDIETATRRVLANLDAVLRAAGSSLDRAVKLTVFMTDLGLFSRMNEVYAGFFKGDPPARSAVQVGALPRGAVIEIEAVAVLEG